MKLALCQMLSSDDKEANAAEMEKLAEQAVAEGADLVVFPEFAMFDLPALSPEFVAAAETLTGPFAARMRELARRTGATVLYGMIEVADQPGLAHNTLLAVGPDGEDVAVYRKQHLYDAFGFQESEYICPGPLGQPATFEVAGVTVGLLTCYDLRFPEPARLLTDAGAQVIVYPAAWVPGPRKEDHWKTLARARAIENTVYVAAVSQAVPIGIGASLVADPAGLVVGELGESTSAVLVREIAPERLAEVRRANPSLDNRRYTVVALT